MRILVALLLSVSWPVLCQVNKGELRLRVTDVLGSPLHATLALICAGNDYRKAFTSDDTGSITVRELPFGIYEMQVRQSGFGPWSGTLLVHSALPLSRAVQLAVASVTIQVNVQEPDTLIDPEGVSSAMQIGAQQIEQRVSSLPGRSLQDLVNSQPGWLYEGNAVLHPRGSEYQTQLVLDGVPLTDNRSPSFGPEIEAATLDSISIYTAGYPAEYGRKMGGVVELNTRRSTDPGLHGKMSLSGGSFDTASAYGQLQEVKGRNTAGISASGGMTSHYLNPVVPQNYTNRGTTADFSASYERRLLESDTLRLSVRHELSRFLIPNELVQQQAGQVQNGDDFETIGSVHYQHILSSASLVSLAGMVRENANNLYSNRNPTPIAAFQHNSFREGYVKGTYSLQHGRHEFKAGVESDATFLHEDFDYRITDPKQFDEDTPPSLTFTAQRPNLEQSAFVEDRIRLKGWTLSAGLRWDHYQLLLNQDAWSPRLSIARYLPSPRMVLHASFDRIFQTPSSENILISSSPQIDALSKNFLRLPVQPSRGNYYEGGLAQSFSGQVRLDVTVYRRDVRNFADDDQLLNTGVSYPIAFNRSIIYGAEGKLGIVHLKKLNGFASYSYMVGNVWLPVTGGLFLGDNANNAASQLAGHFPDSQDQRNTLRTRFEYQPAQRIWFAAGASYGSGLPFEYEGNQQVALATYGRQVIERIDFDRGRIRPLLAINASLSVELYHREAAKVRLQIDGDNLNNRLNVLDFGGLFSGNAIGPQRSVALGLHTDF